MANNYDIGSKLSDPQGTLKDNPEKFQELSKKISSCLACLYRLPENGGNPFLFALANTKSHELISEIPGLGFKFKTAATDGKKYYWNPEFLDSLRGDEIGTVMQHESYHITFFHPERMARFDDKIVANWAIDYIVNGIIWTDHDNIRKNAPLWSENLGEPILFKDLLDWIDGKIEIEEDKKHIFGDKSLVGRSAESIYDEIIMHKMNSPRKCKKCGAFTIDPKTKKPKPPGPCKDHPDCKHKGACCPVCGAEPGPCGYSSGSGMDAMDAHIPAAVNKQEVMTDLMRAAQQAVHMRGLVPNSVKDVLGELERPVLEAKDIIRSICMQKVQESGLKNNYKRFRRRHLPRPGFSLGKYKGQYLPTRHTYLPRWLAMLDTSGSMSQADMAYGISQLQCLGNTEGFIIPCDAKPDWNSVTKIRNATAENLKKTKVSGRGGTLFEEFFADFPAKLGTEFDVIIILTDGDCGTIPMKLKPRAAEVVWILTREHLEGFKPSFGRAIPLRTKRIVPS